MHVVRSSDAHRFFGRIVVLVLLASIEAVSVCASDTATRPSGSPIAGLIARFDSLGVAGTADSDARAGTFNVIARALAYGAPVPMATAQVNGHSYHDSSVAVIDVSDATGHPNDSTVFVLMWDAHGPDTVIFATISQGQLGAGVVLHDSAFTTMQLGTGLYDLTMSAPQGICASFLTQAPRDLNLVAPVGCQTVAISLSFNGLPGFPVGDSIGMPAQTIRAARVEFGS